MVYFCWFFKFLFVLYVFSSFMSWLLLVGFWFNIKYSFMLNYFYRFFSDRYFMVMKKDKILVIFMIVFVVFLNVVVVYSDVYVMFKKNLVMEFMVWFFWKSEVVMCFLKIIWFMVLLEVWFENLGF